MKVKLLKKIRRNYIIMYNPEGINYYSFKVNKEFLVYHRFYPIDAKVFSTLQECKDWILECIRNKYKKKSKPSPNVKVWYNKN